MLRAFGCEVGGLVLLLQEEQPGRQGLRAGADVRLRALLQEQEKLPWMQPSISALALNATGVTLPRHRACPLPFEGKGRKQVPR